jgi:hypothetical protein
MNARATGLLGLAALLAIAGCASTPPPIEGQAVFAHPTEGLLTVRPEGRATLTLRSAGPGWLEIHERYGEDAPERTRKLGPGTRILRRFRGEARIRFVSPPGQRCRVVYELDGNGAVIVSGDVETP